MVTNLSFLEEYSESINLYTFELEIKTDLQYLDL